LTAQYLQQTSSSPGLPIAVNKKNIFLSAEKIIILSF
jgi:hypothetical protein